MVNLTVLLAFDPASQMNPVMNGFPGNAATRGGFSRRERHMGKPVRAALGRGGHRKVSSLFGKRESPKKPFFKVLLDPPLDAA